MKLYYDYLYLPRLVRTWGGRSPNVSNRVGFLSITTSFSSNQIFSAQSVASKNKKFTDISTPASSESIDLIAWQHWRIQCIEKIKLAEPANSDWRDEFLMKCRITDWAKNTLGHATSLKHRLKSRKYSVERMPKGFHNFSWSHFLIFSSFLKVIWLCINHLDRLTCVLISIEVKIPYLCCKLNGKASHVILIK